MFEVTCYDYTGEEIDFLVQWDTGVTIEIRDIELPETPIIHFSNKYSDKSLALRDGVVYENKTLIAPIPDELLREPYMLTVYIYAHEYDKNRGKTTNIAKLPIMAKPKPVGYVEKQTYEGINVLALKVNVDKNTEDIAGLKNDTSALYLKDIEHDNEIGLLKGRVSTNEEDIRVAKENIKDLYDKSSNHEFRISTAESKINTNEEAISILTGTGEGSISKKIDDSFNEFATNMTNDNIVNTFKELVDYVADHAPKAADMAADIKENSANIAINNANISQNATDISNLSKFVGDIPTSSSAMSVVTYADEIVFVESTRATGIESSLSDRLDDVELDIIDVKEDIKDNFEIFNDFKDRSEETIGYLRSDIDKATEDLSKTTQDLRYLEGDVYTKSQVENNFATKSSEHTHDNQDILDGITKESVAQWNSASGGNITDLMSTIFNAIYPIGSIYMSVDSTNPSSVFGGTWASWGNGRVPVGVDSSQTEFATVEKTGGEKSHTLTTAEMPSHTHTGPSHSHNMEHIHTVGAHDHGLANHMHTIPESNLTITGGDHQHYLTYDGDMKITDGTGNRVVANGTGSITPNKYGTVANGSNGTGSHTHTVTIPQNITGGNPGNTAASTPFDTGASSSTDTGSAGTGSTGSAGSGSAHNILQPYITCYMWKRLTLA